MTWKIDPAHSSIGFAVKHMLVARTRGTFPSYTADVRPDPEDVTKSSAVITIDAASIDTGMAARDAHLRSGDFFDVERFPAITFRTRRIEPSGGAYRLVGDLTIRDVTREVALEGELSAPHTDPFGQERAGISAEGRINRKDFGLSWSAPVETGGIVVADTVQLSVELEFVRAA